MGRITFLSSLFSITDEQAMWRLQMDNDHGAFLQLVERWEQPILRLCARMTGDASRGEDLKQETFARVFARRKDFRPGAKFSTWLWRIALNLCYDELRRQRRHGECPLENAGSIEAQASEEISPDVSVAIKEECELVRLALSRLPETHRAALVLRYCEGLKLREVAEALEIPESTASSRIAAGLAQLTRHLRPELLGAKQAQKMTEFGQKQ
jgi:RNA polymerase sigma-70 factor (ECF subfamily)